MSTRSNGFSASVVLSVCAAALSAGLGLWLWQAAASPSGAAAFAAFAGAVLGLASVFLRPAAPLAAAPVAAPPAPPPPSPVATPPPPPALSPPPPAAPVLDAVVVADAGALRLLAVLQEQGRLIDFAMEDIRSVPDAQVAAVARVVHGGCRAALQSAFTLQPLHTAAEGAVVTLAPGFDTEAHRLVGRVAGEAPFTGKLLHRGWRNVAAVKLPHATDPSRPHSGVVAPAEIELR